MDLTLKASSLKIDFHCPGSAMQANKGGEQIIVLSGL